MSSWSAGRRGAELVTFVLSSDIVNNRKPLNLLLFVNKKKNTIVGIKIELVLFTQSSLRPVK